MSAEEDNKALVRRFYEAQTKGELDTLRELLAPGILDHNLRPGQEPGREGFLRAVAEDHAATPTSNTSSLSRWQPKAAGW